MENVRGLLGSIGLEQYAALFEENFLDFDVLRGMTEQDFKEIGIAAFGHRRKLAQAAAALATVRRRRPIDPRPIDAIIERASNRPVLDPRTLLS